MTDSRQAGQSASTEIPIELRDLENSIAEYSSQYPQTKQSLSSSFIRVIDMVTRRRRILDLVQEALAQLRLDVKYLMFDLEVTRRERDELRTRLEELEREY